MTLAAGMSQFEFRFPSVQELDMYAEQRTIDRGWAPPNLDVQDPEEALSRSAFADPISIMITFLRLED